LRRNELGADVNPPIRVGVSPCLLGENVRYAGDHARDLFVSETLGKYFAWVPTCPEVQIGLGVPRPPIQLQRSRAGIRLLMASTGTDLTRRMEEFCVAAAELLASQGLAGYVFKSRSPSCGIRLAKLYTSRGTFRRVGRGFFAADIMRRMPLMPVVTEEELRDPIRRLTWVTRVFATARMNRLWSQAGGAGELEQFHESYVLTVRAHSAAAEGALRKLIRREKKSRGFRAAYEAALHKALDRPTSRAKQVRVLKAIVASLRPKVSREERENLESVVRGYGAADIPLVEAVSILRLSARTAKDASLCASNYLFPDSREWMLRAGTGL